MAHEELVPNLPYFILIILGKLTRKSSCDLTSLLQLEPSAAGLTIEGRSAIHTLGMVWSAGSPGGSLPSFYALGFDSYFLLSRYGSRSRFVPRSANR